jgi:nucleoside-diphosphate-sugar epimerase
LTKKDGILANALISGATGKIGSLFIKKYGARFNKIYRVLGPKHQLLEDDIEYDLASNFLPNLPDDIDVFFHFAAETSIETSKKNPLLNQKINCSSFVKILDVLSKKLTQPYIVLASTATQVGFTNSSFPISESHPDFPLTIYDINKLSAEHFLLNYVNNGLISGCSLRLTNVFGSNSCGYSINRGILDNVFSRAMLGDTITIFGDGKLLRDYIYISDVVDAFFIAWEKQTVTNGKKFLVGRGEGISLAGAFKTAIDVATSISGKVSPIIYEEFPNNFEKINKRSFIADNRLFKNTTGWTSKYNVSEGLLDAYEHLQGFKK